MASELVDQVENFDLYQGGTYNVGGGASNEVSLNELLVALDYHNIEYVPRLPADLDRVVTDNGPVTNVHGWEPTTHWLEGMHQTREWLWSTSGQ